MTRMFFSCLLVFSFSFALGIMPISSASCAEVPVCGGVINGASLVLLVLVFTGFRYLAMVGSAVTFLTVKGLILLLGGA